jgi:DNA-binding Xre family transcriptional regulator
MKGVYTGMPELNERSEAIETTGLLAFSDSSDSIEPMIKLRVQEAARLAGVENPFDLSRRTGLPYEVSRSLWNGDSKMIALKTLDKLCIGLAVHPSQFFEYTAVEPTEQKPAKKAKTK